MLIDEYLTIKVLLGKTLARHKYRQAKDKNTKQMCSPHGTLIMFLENTEISGSKVQEIAFLLL
jgi:hypothetical protein